MKYTSLNFLVFGSLILLFSCKNDNDRVRAVPTLGLPEQQQKMNSPVFSGLTPMASPEKAFSDMVQVGDLYFLSGQIGKDAETGELVPGGIEAETKEALENIQRVLSAKGIPMTSVVRATVILADIEDFAAFNPIFMEYFPQKPARTTFAAESLAKGAAIEIEVTAFMNPEM